MYAIFLWSFSANSGQFSAISALKGFSMNILLLGRGKTGSLVAEVARRRGHDVQVVGAAENANCAALPSEKLRDIDVVIDFTAPSCVVNHIEACVSAGKNMVVGTTGWHGEVDRVRKLV